MWLCGIRYSLTIVTLICGAHTLPRDTFVTSLTRITFLKIMSSRNRHKITDPNIDSYKKQCHRDGCDVFRTLLQALS